MWFALAALLAHVGEQRLQLVGPSLPPRIPNLARWEDMANKVDVLTEDVVIALVGKYTGLQVYSCGSLSVANLSISVAGLVSVCGQSLKAWCHSQRSKFGY